MRGRPIWSVAITVATAVMLGAVAYTGAYSWRMPDPWPGTAVHLAAYVLAIAGVFVVYRWWALLPVIVPIAVNFYIHQYTHYAPPWREEGIGTAAAIPLLFIAVALYAAALALGLLLRWVYEAIRARRHGGSSPHPGNLPAG